ncbi:MAG: ABC transporter ATP-binding protein [Oligoflexia bacterium]|nr:ABC transporter ATP-binding protein [Oligoflexia bacterium]
MVIKIENLLVKRKIFKLQIDKLLVGQSQRVALLGHNGSGKSTLIAAMLNFEKRAAGEVKIFGHDPRGELKKVLPLLSYVPQNPDEGLFCSTVREDILFAPHNFSLPYTDSEILKKVLEKIPVVEALLDRPPHELSYGEKKVAVLATALATNPKLLIMDEPFSMLDCRQKDNLEKIITLYEGTLVIASHEHDRVARLCKRFLVLQEGMVVFDGGMDDLSEAFF